MPDIRDRQQQYPNIRTLSKEEDQIINDAVAAIQDRLTTGDLASSDFPLRAAQAMIIGVAAAWQQGFKHFDPDTDQELTSISEILTVLSNKQRIKFEPPDSQTPPAQ